MEGPREVDLVTDQDEQFSLLGKIVGTLAVIGAFTVITLVVVAFQRLLERLG